MATYVNDLRLKEIATGDESGTWGTSTNTNLELIGEALGYGTQDCFSSDADATTTVADGATDPARAMYFKVTSSATLTATRTLTIAPNTISRVMFIENATTGSQSIAISQGSGANVTIATGKTAVVYLDGAGSGAAVVDAMALVDPGVTDTLAEVLVAGNTSGGTGLTMSSGDDLTLTGASYNVVWDSSDSALEFADNAKAVFGAGSDLQIYHDASDSIINDNGTGSLKLQTGASTKLEVTSTGIDVTGSISADGLTVDGTATIDGASGIPLTLDADAGANTNLQFSENGALRWYLRSVTSSNDFNFYGNSQNRLNIGSGGDISFYDTSGNAKFFWDASAESLGIGTSSPSSYPVAANLVVDAGTNGGITVKSGSSNYGGVFFADGTTGNEQYRGFVQYNHNYAGSTDALLFGAAGTEAMRIDSSGNVGLKNSSPSSYSGDGADLVIGTTSGDNGLSIISGTSGTGNIYFGDVEETGTGSRRGQIVYDHATDHMRFATAASESMRIDSSGNVGIGLSTGISSKLHVNTEMSLGADADNRAIVGYTPSRAYIGTRQGGTNYFDTLNVSGGNVGIGTASPDTKLHLSDGGTPEFRLESTDTSVVSGQSLGDITWESNDVSGGGQGVRAKIHAEAENAGTIYGLVFSTGAGAAPTEKVRITNTGNVGISTSSPQKTLDVKGTFAISNSTTSYWDFDRDDTDGSLKIADTGTQRMAIDSSGNVGIGTTPKSWASGFTALQIGGLASFYSQDSAASAGVQFTQNGYYDGSWKYMITDEASRYFMGDGTHRWFTASSGTADTAISWSEAMRVDTHGDLLLGNSSNTFNSTGRKCLEITGSDNSLFALSDTQPGSLTNRFYIHNDRGNGLITYLSQSGIDQRWYTGGAERMRLTNGGFFKAQADASYISATGNYHEFNSNAGTIVNYVRNTSASGSGIIVNCNNSDNTHYYFSGYSNSASATRIHIHTSGNIYNTNGTYGTLSDIKLKQDVVDAASQWDDIKDLRVRKFHMKDEPDGPLQLGLIAQEVEETSPGLVEELVDRDSENNDLGTTTKAVKYSILYMKAVKALQEAMDRIETLEAKVAQLEGAN